MSVAKKLFNDVFFYASDTEHYTRWPTCSRDIVCQNLVLKQKQIDALAERVDVLERDCIGPFKQTAWQPIATTSPPRDRRILVRRNGDIIFIATWASNHPCPFAVGDEWAPIPE
jgi:hypothetical protein